MSDEFLKDLSREPRPAFARALRERLREAEAPEARPTAWRPALAVAGAVAVVAVVFSVPAVRVSAQALLDMFRVRNFAVVEFDSGRFDKLRSLKQDHALFIFDEQQKIQDPGPATAVPTPAAAVALAGFDVRTPSYLPAGLTLARVEVQGEARARLVVHEEKLRAVLDALEVRDVLVPTGLDGKAVEVHTRPVVVQKYTNDWRELHLIQSPSPEVGLPPDVDLARMGEIGLRILGLEPGEARRMAGAIDWHSTLVVPVPANASSFREVTIHGSKGLLVTTTGAPDKNGRTREGAVLIWTEGDRMFALQGNQRDQDLVLIAESVH